MFLDLKQSGRQAILLTRQHKSEIRIPKSQIDLPLSGKNCRSQIFSNLPAKFDVIFRKTDFLKEKTYVKQPDAP